MLFSKWRQIPNFIHIIEFQTISFYSGDRKNKPSPRSNSISLKLNKDTKRKTSITESKPRVRKIKFENLF